MQNKDFRRNVFFFGPKALIAFLAYLNAFVPISTDLYLPGLPRMAVYFEGQEQLVQLTLSLFMLFFALSMLVWGPLTDKLGRRKILFAGLVLYVLSSLLCAGAQNVWQLILGRVLQAVGCGAVQAVSMAIVKDVFEGRIMENVLVWIQTMTILGPMIAPLLGAFLLKFTSWRGLFWMLFAFGMLALAVALLVKETLKEPTGASVLKSFGRIRVVLRDAGLRWLLLVFALAAMPFMAYLAVSAFIYEDIFCVSTETYSYFFAANAAFSILGPLLYMRILREIPRWIFIAACFGLTALSGALLLPFGGAGPFVFALIFLPVTFLGSALRPVGTVLVMSQLDGDNGTVASLMGCTALMCGSLSMILASLGGNPVFAVGVICLVVGLACLGLWLFIDKRRMYRSPEGVRGK